MKLVKTLVALVLAGGLSACASIEPATRGGPAVEAPVIPQSMTANSAKWNVVDVRVDVPRDLSVSEANRYYPVADIVWRGDAYGDRHEQVRAIMDDGLTRGVKHLNGNQPVFFDIKVSRFHSLTEKARYSTGGVHNMIFTLTVVDARTNVPLHGPVLLELDLKAYGGVQAFEAERRGHTQKVRVMSHLTTVMRRHFPGFRPDATAQVTRNATSDAFVPAGYEAIRR